MRKEQQKQGKLPMYDGRCKLLDPQTAKERAKKEQCVIRLNMPDTGKTAWQDLIRGHIEFDNMLVDDQVLVKSDGFPTYHLAVVVDDHFMKITHVLRGEEWISSTPKHLVLYDFFGWEKPMFAHMPLLRNPDHSKLSKRKNDVSLISYMKQGYLPEALLNFLCLLGWSHPKGEEIFSLENFLEHFSIERMQKTGPVFDFNKLKWMNGVYIREKISLEDLTNRLTPHIPKEFPQDKLSAVLVLIRERLVVLSDFASLTDFLYSDVTVDKSALQIKKADDQLIQKQLTQTIASIQNITQWNHEIIETAMRTLQENQDWKRSQYFMMIRIAVTGKTATPPLFETMQLIGKEKILERLKKAQSVF